MGAEVCPTIDEIVDMTNNRGWFKKKLN